MAVNNKQTNVKLLKRFDNWKYDDYGIEKRMPWISGAKLTTSRNATGDRQWGTLIGDKCFFFFFIRFPTRHDSVPNQAIGTVRLFNSIIQTFLLFRLRMTADYLGQNQGSGKKCALQKTSFLKLCPGSITK